MIFGKDRSLLVGYSAVRFLLLGDRMQFDQLRMEALRLFHRPS